ncbi:ribokinase [Microbacterium saperdae]
MNARIVVVGSLNLDRTYSLGRLPREGESLHATGHAVASGGKGANQAVAASRLGADVRLVGAVGADAAGTLLLDAVAESGVDVTGVHRRAGDATGEAVIFVDDEGQNLIVISPGANATVTADDVVSHGAGWVLSGFEIPDEAVIAAAHQALAAHARFVLNPSPYRRIPDALAHSIDVMVVNEHELIDALGTSVDSSSDTALLQARARLDVPALVVTLGADGAAAVTASGVFRAPGRVVTAVDTSGAGDAFTGALVARLASGDALESATLFATQVGAHAATRPGTQSSYPTSDELDRWLQG